MEPIGLLSDPTKGLLGTHHGITQALAKASITMDRVDLLKARLAVNTSEPMNGHT